MALWDAMPFGQLSPVKAGRLAATSYMRNFIFRNYHEKQEHTLELIAKMTSGITAPGKVAPVIDVSTARSMKPSFKRGETLSAFSGRAGRRNSLAATSDGHSYRDKPLVLPYREKIKLMGNLAEVRIRGQ